MSLAGFGARNESAGKPRYPADTLGLGAQEMRRLGHRVVDLVIDRLERKNDEPAILAASPHDLIAALGEAVPEEPGNPDAAIELLASVALAHQQHADHPRYFARVPGPCSFAAILGEWLATGYNTTAAAWLSAAGPSAVELIVIEWLRLMTGLPEGTEGVLSSGGSLANFTAFATARAAVGPGVAYLTDQTHSSLLRDLLALGLPHEAVRILPSDDGFRMSVRTLTAAIQEDRSIGRHAMIVIASAGTTNTGAVDPLDEIAEVCRKHDIWFHVDGAYGGPAAICEEGRAYLTGLEKADSLVLDPHKWLFQPYDVGATFMMRRGALERCFSMSPEYLKDVEALNGEVDFRNRSLELTRRSRAIKLWLTLRVYGAARIRDAIRSGIALARFAENVLRERPNIWEVVTPAQIGIVTFALRGVTAPEHEARVRALADSGYACVSSTMLKGRKVFRLCTINPLTTEDDIRGTIDYLAREPE